MIIHNNNRCEVRKEIIKQFTKKETYLKEKAAASKLIQYDFIPKCIFKDNTKEIIMDEYIPLIEWAKGKNKEQLRNMAIKILNIIKHLHHRDMIHNDLHANNILVDDDNPLIIDFEHFTYRTNKCKWWESNDVTGYKYMGFDSLHNLSCSYILGYKSKDLVDEIRSKDLLNELIHISKDVWGSKNGMGLCYGSYHHPRFNVVDAQRNSVDRFDLLKIDVRDKKVLDLGCNTGAMSVMAAMMGAFYVLGYEIDYKNVNFCEDLRKFLHLRCKFEEKNINTVKELPKVDVIFALAINHWVNEAHLLDLLEKSGAETIYFEDNHKEKEFELKGYSVEYVGERGGRKNYVCKKVKE